MPILLSMRQILDKITTYALEIIDISIVFLSYNPVSISTEYGLSIWNSFRF